MAAYATVDQFVAAVTEAEARALAPKGTAYDDVRIGEALEDICAEIDTYLHGKYATPVEPAPRTLRTAAIALCREKLDLAGRDQVTAAAKRARDWLKDVSRGVAILAGDEADQEAPATEANGGGVQFTAGERVFDDAGLNRFLRG